MDKCIQFVANYDDWKAIKKLKIEKKTDARTVMEFLASLGIGIDTRIEENLRKVVDLEKVDAAVNEELSSGADAGEIISSVSGRRINSVINEICNKPELQKNEQKELQGFCKVYALKKALKELKLNVDYSGVEIPGLKRLRKTKV